MDATGGFGDRVDRQLLFTATGAGTIGGSEARNLIVSWSSEGSSAYGRLAGVLNLSNNGGFWNWDDAAGSWTQTNDNLVPGAPRTAWRWAAAAMVCWSPE